jgi:hypothetical protein
MNGFLYQSPGANRDATFFYARIEDGAVVVSAGADR